MSELAPPLVLMLNADGVVGPALGSMRRASEIVAFMLNTIATTDLSKSPRPAEAQSLGLAFDDMPADYDRAKDFSDWVLERGFRDLAHGIRMSLEEAYLYVDFARNPPQNVPVVQVYERETIVRRAGNKLNFVQLLAAVNAGLRAPLSFDDEFLSLQKVRNCLEHRHGVVGPQDVDHANGMRLVLPCVKLFFKRDDEEIDIEAGQYFAEETEILYRRDMIERFFPLSSRVIFSPTEFDNIAMACVFFASDLGQKLPQVGEPKN
ncbi:MAG TPA: hypothetical protein VGV17_05690 [Bosea sp. (in: a-proteobacteria)]|jgi:hypothetical protein|uniref:hypothetical protein n=1 Tax=Bosea sp. (in: a-proteobacteria) TaxID=1871050 RepID=UPI002DDCCEC5|nr:hypothetical protein [Bosea sp. (in: a-proteobacteria)]HEV2553232.1 hypothetical protein [Bosea sp. (in: a-proteobacteria)]